MKTLIKTLVVAILSLSFVSAGFTADDKDMMKDHVMMKDGKMMMMKDGSKVMTDGTVMMKDGKKMMMKDGDMMMMDGKMMKHEMKKEGDKK